MDMAYLIEFLFASMVKTMTVVGNETTPLTSRVIPVEFKNCFNGHIYGIEAKNK